MNASPLSVRNLAVAYDGNPVLEGVTLNLRPARLTALIGPNGAGKSTLLKAVLGLIPAQRGIVSVFGREARHALKAIAYMPQHEEIDWDFPLSALDVAAMGLYDSVGWCRPVRRRHRLEASACLARTGMEDYAEARIGALSGGQRRRVLLARALARKASLYLLDEPFAGVDAASQDALLKVFHALREEGATLFCVHHDLLSVGARFDDAILLNRHVLACGAAKEVCTPRSLAEAYGVPVVG